MTISKQETDYTRDLSIKAWQFGETHDSGYWMITRDDDGEVYQVIRYYPELDDGMREPETCCSCDSFLAAHQMMTAMQSVEGKISGDYYIHYVKADEWQEMDDSGCVVEAVKQSYAHSPRRTIVFRQVLPGVLADIANGEHRQVPDLCADNWVYNQWQHRYTVHDPDGLFTITRVEVRASSSEEATARAWEAMGGQPSENERQRLVATRLPDTFQTYLDNNVPAEYHHRFHHDHNSHLDWPIDSSCVISMTKVILRAKRDGEVDWKQVGDECLGLAY